MSSISSPAELQQTCPTCAACLDISDYEPLQEVLCPQCRTGILVQRSYNQFAIVASLGQGGMGTVYKAYDTQLNRFVAFKLVHQEYCTEPDCLAKLEKEAKITASINHPNVVQVYMLGQYEHQLYMVMELVELGSLDDLIERYGRVPEGQILEIGIQVAQGLQAAYLQGLIHRDIKPGNILFADKNTAKVSDFGLAALANQTSEGGEIWGTPYYIAPEKLCNLPEDHRSDLYSLGATLFHALAGRPPYDAENCSTLALKHLNARAVSVQSFAPDISNETARVINRMLEKNPGKRYQNYEELIAHLKYAQRHISSESGRGAESKRDRVIVETAAQRTFWGWATATMLLLAVLGTVGIAISFRNNIAHENKKDGGQKRATNSTIEDTAAPIKAAPIPETAQSASERPTQGKKESAAISGMIDSKNTPERPPQAEGEETFVNASFEEPQINGHSFDSAGTSWTFTNSAGIQHNGSAYSGDLAKAPDGTQTAILQGVHSGLGTMSQSLKLAAGTYKIHFSAARRWDSIQPIRICVDGKEVGVYTPVSSAFEVITTENFTVGEGDRTITFAATVNTGDKSTFIDAVGIARVGRE